MTNTESPMNAITRVFSSLQETAERDTYIRALRERGWTLDQVAHASGLTRVDVRRIESKTDLSGALDLVARGYPLPEPATMVTRTGRPSPRGSAPDPSSETLSRLRTLKPLAELVRSSSPRFRAEAEEYTALLNHAIQEEGTTVYRLAKLLGVTHGALYFRLTRYGYRTTPAAQVSTSKIYKPINPKNRYKAE